VASTTERAFTSRPLRNTSPGNLPGRTVARSLITSTPSGSHRRSARSARVPGGSPGPPAASPTGMPSASEMRAATSSRESPSTGGSSSPESPAQLDPSERAKASAAPSRSKPAATSRKV
jgi:hypothetical protein